MSYGLVHVIFTHYWPLLNCLVLSIIKSLIYVYTGKYVCACVGECV